MLLNRQEVFASLSGKRLIPRIQALYAENGSPITLLHGAVFSDPAAPEAVTFYVRGNFLGSGLDVADAAKARPVQVPVIRYADLTARHPHDVLLMDIEGAERDFLRHADLSGVRLIIAEFHRKIYGREGMRDCRRMLAGHGFVMDSAASALGVHVWRRG